MTRKIETRVVRLTPAIPGAIATIGVYGPQSHQLVSRSFQSPSGQSNVFDGMEPRYGLWQFRQSDLPPEHVVVLRSADDEFEINCHGGLTISEAILQELELQGCRLCTTNQWYTPGLLSIEAAAEQALTQAATLKIAAILLDQYQGALRRELVTCYEAVQRGDLSVAQDLCGQLMRRAVFGLRLLKPPRLTLAGPPNVGKSSLINALCGTGRVLVHHQPGTTRDAIDSTIVASSWPMIITDTAGVRATTELVEVKGIETAWQRWRNADIGLLIVDASAGWSTTHDELLHVRTQATIIVLNKSDLIAEPHCETAIYKKVDTFMREGRSVRVVKANAITPDGTVELLSMLGEHCDAGLPPPGSAVLFNAEQVDRLQQVSTCLAEERMEAAKEALRAWLSLK